MKRLLQWLAVWLVLAGTQVPAGAQVCDSLVLAPDSMQMIVSGSVTAMARAGDTLYVAGAFDYIGRPTGSFVGLDTSAGRPLQQSTWPRVHGTVYCSAPDGNGGWIIGGSFDRVGGKVRSNLAQIDAAGTLTAWDPAANDIVYALAVSNGKAFAGGAFTMIGTAARNRLAAIQLSSGLATAWNPSIDNTVRVLLVDTNIFIAGDFMQINSTSRPGLAALDTVSGTLLSFSSPGITYQIRTMLLDGDKLYVGGGFTGARNRLACVNKTTGALTAWNPNANNDVYALLKNGNTIYAGGEFSTIGGTGRPRLAAIDATTGTLTSWIPDAPVNGVHALALAGTTLYAGGTFLVITAGTGGYTRYGLAAFSTLTGKTTTYQPAVASSAAGVLTLQTAGDRLYVGGGFAGAGGAMRSGLAAYDLVNNRILPWAPPGAPSGYGAVSRMLVTGNKLILCGYSTLIYAPGIGRNYLAAFDLSTGGTLLPWNPGANLNVDEILGMDVAGNDLYVGGRYINNPYVGRIDLTTGAISSSWTPAVTGVEHVHDVIVRNNAIYVTGTSVGVTNYVPLQKFSLATGAAIPGYYPTFSGALGAPTAHSVYQYKSRFYVAGNFAGVSGAGPYVAAVDTGGTGARIPWNPAANARVNKAVALGRYVYSAGAFTTYSGATRYGLGVSDSLGNLVSAWRPQFNSGVSYTPAGWLNDMWTDGTTLIAGGYFTDVSGQPLIGLARFNIGSYPTATVSISTLATAVCAGAAATFTAATAVSGATYQWKKNGVNAGSNSATFTYTPAANDVITCTITVPANSCYFNPVAVSNAVTVNIVQPGTATATVTAAANPVCAGVPVLFNAATNVTGAAYQWRVNSINAGTGNAAFTYVPANGDTVRVTVTPPAGACYTAASVSSNDIIMSVTPNTVPQVQITGATTVCPGVVTTYAATANSSNVAYQWKVNGANTGTLATYSYLPAAGDQVSCVVTPAGTGCYSPATATSNILTVSLLVPVTPTLTITANNSVCAGQATTVTAVTNVVNPQFQWAVNGMPAGGNMPVYTYTPANNDQVTCAVIVPATGCYSSSSAAAGPLTMTVTPLQTPSVQLSGPAAAATGTIVTINATVSNAGSGYQIVWKNGTTTLATTTVPMLTYTKNRTVDTITATVSSTDNCFSTAVSGRHIVNDLPSGIGGPRQASRILVYPNPFDQLLRLSGAVRDDHILLLDISGRQVAEWTITATRPLLELSLPLLPAASYLLVVQHPDGLRERYPLVKQ